MENDSRRILFYLRSKIDVWRKYDESCHLITVKIMFRLNKFHDNRMHNKHFNVHKNHFSELKIIAFKNRLPTLKHWNHPIFFPFSKGQLPMLNRSAWFLLISRKIPFQVQLSFNLDNLFLFQGFFYELKEKRSFFLFQWHRNGNWQEYRAEVKWIEIERDRLFLNTYLHYLLKCL